jgi:predicted methyltransferase
MPVINRFQKKPKFISPNEVIDSLSLSKGQSVIDYGSGAGFWAIPLAKKVGPKGVVYAIDDRKDRLEALGSMAKFGKVANIKTSSYEKMGGPITLKQKVDLILVSNILSEINNHEDLLTTLSHNTEPGTKLVIIDWNKESKLGPVISKRVIEDEVILLAAKAGFKFEKQLDAGTFHWGLLFIYTGEKYHARKK